MTTDLPDRHEDNRHLVGYGMAKRAAKEVYNQAVIGPE